MADLTKEARYDEAIALKEKGDVIQAVQLLEDLCRDHPDYALPHAALSMLYCRLDKFQECLDHAELVCELEPEDPFSFVAMSALAIKSGNHAAAEEALQKAQLAQLRYLHSQAKPAGGTDTPNEKTEN
ncbi:MAG: hypothetical protein J6A23_01610 [Thermoguttaceae bacterium]|nr:hypothetical protein [Thermoguttaceae bacterium]MBP3693278.1 hypothetical protein [Thermoguttaceae bacterium]